MNPDSAWKIGFSGFVEPPLLSLQEVLKYLSKLGLWGFRSVGGFRDWGFFVDGQFSKSGSLFRFAI